jgi:hypothetical protein
MEAAFFLADLGAPGIADIAVIARHRTHGKTITL